MVASIRPVISAWTRVGSSPITKKVTRSRFSSSPKCFNMRKEATCEELPKPLMASLFPLRSSGRLISGFAHMSYVRRFVIPSIITVSAPPAAADVTRAAPVEPMAADSDTIAWIIRTPPEINTIVGSRPFFLKNPNCCAPFKTRSRTSVQSSMFNVSKRAVESDPQLSLAPLWKCAVACGAFEPAPLKGRGRMA